MLTNLKMMVRNPSNVLQSFFLSFKIQVSYNEPLVSTSQQ